MKRLTAVLIGCVLLAGGGAFSAAVLAESGPGADRPHFGKHHRPGGKGAALEMLARYQMKNLAAQTAVELSGQPVERIDELLESKGPRGVFEELGIDRDRFRAAMAAKVRERVREAAANGSITAEQESEILTRMEKRANRHALIRQLIEQGVSDGTITAEQAKTLEPRPR